MKIINCFEVLGNTDTTEGRGPMKVVARFNTWVEAEKYVKSAAYSRWCVMGVQSDADVKYNIKEATVIILDTVDELSNMEREQLKASALAKLTNAEREALGI